MPSWNSMLWRSSRPHPTARPRLALLAATAILLALVLSACTATSPAHDATLPPPIDSNPSDPCLAQADLPALPSTWQPWTWNGYDTFPSLYFAAEPDGPLSAAQMAKIARFSLAILEFRAGQFAEEATTGRWAGGDLAGFMEAEVARFQTAYPDGPPMLVYRSAEWAGAMFAQQRNQLASQELFLPFARDCDGFVEYPMDVDESGYDAGLPYCRWDFRRCDTQQAFLDVVRLAAQGASAGVFFDGAHGVACDEAQELSGLDLVARQLFMDAQHVVFRRAFSDLVHAGKYPVLSTTIGFDGIGAQVPWGNDCPRAEEALLDALAGVPFARNNEFWMWNLGDLASRQILNAIEEADRGVPTMVHMPYFPEDGGCLEGCWTPEDRRVWFGEEEFLEFGMAAFLVSMGPGSYFGFSDMQTDAEGGGWFDVSWPYYEQYDTVVTGAPLGPATVSEDAMVFHRSFENGEVSVNVAEGTYRIDLR